jgi:hypothetical protein
VLADPHGQQRDIVVGVRTETVEQEVAQGLRVVGRCLGEDTDQPVEPVVEVLALALVRALRQWPVRCCGGSRGSGTRRGRLLVQGGHPAVHVAQVLARCRQRLVAPGAQAGTAVGDPSTSPPS